MDNQDRGHHPSGRNSIKNGPCRPFVKNNDATINVATLTAISSKLRPLVEMFVVVLGFLLIATACLYAWALVMRSSW